MTFRQAYNMMLNGYKVKRPMFKGYWFIDSLDGKMKIYTKDGSILCGGEFQITVVNILAVDWMVVDE